MSYTQDQIRNIVLAGHSGSGKTTLAEALLYRTGGSDRLGRVEEGNTVSDYDPDEIKRRASMQASMIPVDYTGVRLNFIDVPGLFDFELGLYEAMPAVESALICVSARDGLQVGAGKAYRLAEKYGKSKMFYISEVDVENADFYKVFEDLKAEYGPSVCPVVVPVEQAGGRVYVNLIDNQAFSYAADGTAREVPVPSIIEETSRHLKNAGYKKAGIMATAGTVSSGSYQEQLQKLGLDFAVPDSTHQQYLHELIYDDVKSGRDPDLEKFYKIVDHLKEKGCDKLILGCTELSLINRAIGGDPIFCDSLEVLAYTAIKACGSETVGFSEDFKD